MQYNQQYLFSGEKNSTAQCLASLYLMNIPTDEIISTNIYLHEVIAPPINSWQHLKHCWEPLVWGVVDDLNAFGVTHLGEIPEIILLNTVELLDNFATRLHGALCVCDVVLRKMIDWGKHLSMLVSGNILLYLYFVAGFIKGTEGVELYTRLYLLLAQPFFLKAQFICFLCSIFVVPFPFKYFDFLSFGRIITNRTYYKET